jgi:hypothetical protein
MKQIKYKKGYKYQLAEDYSIQLELLPEDIDLCNLESTYLILTADGILTIKAGYAWDGPSGPTYDTDSFMRGSLVHDALYQLMREEVIPSSYKKYADSLLKTHCLEDRMYSGLANLVYFFISRFGLQYVLPENKHQIIISPKALPSKL